MAVDYQQLKKTLQELLDQKKREKEQAESDRKRKNEEDRNFIISSIGESLKPIFQEMMKNAKITKEDLKEALNISIPEIKSPNITIPKINLPTIRVPKPEVTVNVPQIKIPKIEIPKLDFPSDLEVSLRKDFDNRNPMPVILMDNKGNPYMAVSGASAPRVVDVNVINPYTSISDGRRTVTTAGTAVRLTAVSTNAKTVIITALLANTDVVVIGGSGVIAAAGTRTGIPLLPGEAATLAFNDLTNIWLDSVVNGEGVSFLVMN